MIEILRKHYSSLAVIVLYTFLALAMTYPLILHMTEHVPSDVGDPIYNIWIMEWDIHALLTGLKDFWNANIFFPHQGTVLYADYIFALALIGSPIAAVSHNLILAYNVLFILSFFLCGYAMYLLVYHLTRVRAAAIVAGIIFAFCPSRMAHISHLELLYFAWTPLCFLFLNRFFDNPSFRNLTGIGLFFVLQALSCAYYGVYLSLFAGLFIVYFAHKKGFFRRKDFWVKMGILGLCCFIVLIPFFSPFLRVHKEMMFTRNLPEVEYYSTQLQNFLNVPPWNFVWGRILKNPGSAEWNRFPGVIVLLLVVFWLLSRRRSRLEEFQREGTRLFFWWDTLTALYLLFILHVAKSGGFTIQWGDVKILSAHRLRNPLIILAISMILRFWMAVRQRGRSRPDVPTSSLNQRFFLFISILAWLLAMGPAIKLFDRKILTGPYILLYEWVPIFQSLRAPSRLAMMMMMGLALLSGWAIVTLMERQKNHRVRKLIPLLVGILILVSYVSIPLPLDFVPGAKKIPEIYRHVQALPSDTVLIELPMPEFPPNRGREALLMYYSIFHRKKLVNGYSGYFPPGYIIVYESMTDFPSNQTFRLLRDLEVDYILVHTQRFRADKGQQMNKLIQAFPEDVELKAAAEGDFLYLLLPRDGKREAGRNLKETGDRMLWKAWSSTNVIETKLAFDGDPSTGWSNGHPQRRGDFYFLDMGKPVQVGELELLVPGKPLDYPRGFTVEGSLDQKTWILLSERPFFIPRITRSNVEDLSGYRVEVNFEVKNVRYLRIKLTRSHRAYHWSIQEIRCGG